MKFLSSLMVMLHCGFSQATNTLLLDGFHQHVYLSDIGIDVSTMTSLLFKIQTCNAGKLTFTDNRLTSRLDIIFSDKAYARPLIKCNTKECSTSHTVGKNTSLDPCTSPADLWLSWKSGIALGKGSTVGESTVLSAPLFFKFRHAYVGSSVAKTTETWQFASGYQNVKHLYLNSTKRIYLSSVGIDILRMTHLSFALETCGNSKLTLVDKQLSTKWKIFFNYRSTFKSVIRCYGKVCNTSKMTYNTALDLCSSPKELWVSWKGRIAVGSGNVVGDTTLINYPYSIDVGNAYVGSQAVRVKEIWKFKTRANATKTNGTRTDGTNTTWTTTGEPHTIRTKGNKPTTATAEVTTGSGAKETKTTATTAYGTTTIVRVTNRSITTGRNQTKSRSSTFHLNPIITLLKILFFCSIMYCTL